MPTDSPPAPTQVARVRGVRALGRRIAAVPPWCVLAIAWLMIVLYAFPGQMTQDSWDHLTEARKNVFTDAHPPVMDLLFRWLDAVIAGPFLILVLQTTALVVGLARILAATFTRRAAAWLTLGLVLYPPIMTPMAVAWKDSVMAGCLVLGVAALQRKQRALALVALFAATAVRYNAFAATLPLIVLCFEWRPGARAVSRYAVAFVVWLAITMSAAGVNRWLTDQPMYYWQSSLTVHDIVGTLSLVPGERSDAELERLFAGTGLLIHHDIHKALRAHYRPDNFLPIINEPSPLWGLPNNGFVPAPASVRAAITRAWWEVITSEPAAYLHHRLAVMYEVISIGPRKMPAAVIRRDAYRWPEYAHQMGQGTGWSALQGLWTRLLRAVVRATPVFEPWIYLAISLLLLPLARRQRDVLALLCSGLVLESTLVLLAPSADYRYSHWMVITTCLAVIVLTARRSRGPAIRA